MQGFTQKLLDENKESYRRLEFGAAIFENVDEFYEAYRIPKEEHILVYADRGRGAGRHPDTDATVITDEAIYMHPKHQPVTGGNRIPVGDLCRFIVYQDGKKVALLHGDTEYSIYRKGMPSRESVGDELTHFLRLAQKQSMLFNKEERIIYDNTLVDTLLLIKKEFAKYGLLDERYIGLLQIIKDEPDFAGEATMLLAEAQFRLCNEEAYLLYILSQKDVLSPEMIVALQQPENLSFYDHFIRDLSDLDGFVMSELLIESYLNLRKKPRLNIHQARLLCYLCTRMDDMDYLYEILDIIGDRMDEASLWELEDFIARHKNAKMRAVHAKLLAGEELYPTEIVLSDDLGLTPFHYALMTRDKDIVERTLAIAKWENFKSPFPKDKIVDTVYDYNLLAALLFEDEDLIQKIYARTNPQAQALARSIHQMEVFAQISEQVMAREPHRKAELKKKQKEYMVMRREMETELAVLSHVHAVHLYEKAAIIRDIGHPLATYVLELIDTPEALFTRTAGTIFGHKLMRYKNLFFVAPPEEDRGLSYYQWDNGMLTDTHVIGNDSFYSREGSESVRGDYYDGDLFVNPSEVRAIEERERAEAERKKKREAFFREQERMRRLIEREMEEEKEPSWFSDKAHHDLSLLKKEYRLLVKKYHPDSSGSRHTANTLQEIMLERASILEHMEAV